MYVCQSVGLLDTFLSALSDKISRWLNRRKWKTAEPKERPKNIAADSACNSKIAETSGRDLIKVIVSH